MSLDLRSPLGLLFGVFGLLLTGYGLLGDSTVYAVSFGVNVNLWMGLLMLLFGGGMLLGARFGRH